MFLPPFQPPGFLCDKLLGLPWLGLVLAQGLFFLHEMIILVYSRFQMTFHCNIPNFVAKFRSSLRSSKVRCEVQKFISEFANRFVN